ncbi:MAG: hypothetical protein ABI361_13285 [Nitrososphaera sp.]|jgi:hypothetical protein
MRKSAAASLILAAAVSFGLIFSSKAAYAHNFGGDESAGYLAKVQEVPVEAHAILTDANNKDLLSYHLDKIGEYWTANDTKEMNERNANLAKNIPGTIQAIKDAANKTNPDIANITQLVSKLDSYMAESVPVRLDQPQLQNLTVNAIAIKDVLGEVMEGYGDATNGTSKIVDQAPYQNAKGLATAAQSMWNTLKAKTPSNVSSTTISNLDNAFSNLTQSIAQNASDDTIVSIANHTIASNFATAYKTQVVPEFPMPLTITAASLAGVIVFARYVLRGRAINGGKG